MSNRKRAASLFMIAVVALSLVSGAFVGAAAAETTTLAGDGTDTVPEFTGNESNDIAYSLSSDGTDFSTDGTTTAVMNVTYDGETYATVEETIDDTATASYTINITNDQLSELPGDAGETTNVTVNAWGENADGNETTTGASFTVGITFDNTYASTSVDDSSATIEDVEPGLFSFDTLAFWSSSEPADLHTYEQTVGVDGSNTTVTLNDDTSNGSDAFDAAIDEDAESGDLITGAATGVNGTPELAFYESANSDMVNTSTDTYFVYDSSTDVWTLHVGDEYSDASELDVYVSSQAYDDVESFDSTALGDLFIGDADMGLGALGSNFGWSDLGSFNLGDLAGSLSASWPFMIGGDALAFGAIAPIGLKRRQMRA